MSDTTYTDPRGLPEGVELRIADGDTVYFVDHISKTTRWEDPRTSADTASYNAALERDMRAYLHHVLTQPTTPHGRLPTSARQLGSPLTPVDGASARALHAPPYRLTQLEQQMERLATPDVATAAAAAATTAPENATAPATAATVATATAAAACAATRTAHGDAARRKTERPTPRRVEGAPPQFFCPITLAVMSDPVITADGQTYERHAIEKWLLGNATSPLTGKALPHFELAPNVVLRSLIEDFIDKQPAEGVPAEVPR